MALSEGELYACYRRLEKPLFNVLYRWLWNAAECQDVLHDAFVRVWSLRDRVDAARLDALVWTAALNVARNRLRWQRLRRGTAVAAATADDDPFQATERVQRDRRLRLALARLPRALRAVLLLSEFGGLSLAQIAQILRVPPGTVGSRKHVALQRLRAALGEDDHDDSR